jgi:hypothetical protein
MGVYGMQLPIPWDWNGVDTCDLSICWPDSVLWRGILHGLLEMPSQGRFWDFTTGNFLELRASFKPIYDANFGEFQEAIVSCNDEKFERLLEALDGISASVSATATSGCGCGAGGAGSDNGPLDEYSEAESEGEPPEGFEDLEGYRAHKCNASWLILNDLGRDLNGLSSVIIAVTSVPEVVAIIIAVLVAPIPFSNLLTLAGILIFGLVAFSFLSATSALIFDNRFDLVCLLYGADSAGQAKIDFVSGISDLLDSETAWNGTEKGFVLTVVDLLLSNIQMNKLTSAVYVPEQTEDCSHCDPCPVTYDASSDWGGWTSVDTSTNSGSSTGTITNKLAYTVSVAAAPSGESLGQRKFIIPLAEVFAAGWVSGAGATITAQMDNITHDQAVNSGHVIMVDYDVDATQFGATSSPEGPMGFCDVVLNSDDAIAEIAIFAGQSRPSGTNVLNSEGEFVSVEFCNA